MKYVLKSVKFACKHLLRRNPGYRFRALLQIGQVLRPDYRFKWPQLDWWGNAEFNRYLERFDELSGLNTDRRWMLAELLRLVDDIDGDTAECGVFTGASSYLVCRANAQAKAGGKCHHMFDSFAGLSKPVECDGDHWTAGDLTCGLETVRANLAEFRDVAYYPGWIPTRFAEVADKRFSFVHIDVDLYEPTRDSIAFFYPRMAEGGVLVVDDYGCTTCPGATRAVDEVLASHPEKMLRCCSGGGFIIHGRTVAPQRTTATRAA
jgi:hypothetical protein